MRRWAALFLALLLCLPLPQAAAETAPFSVKVYIDGLLRLRGYRIDGALWLCPEDLCALYHHSSDTVCDGEAYRLILPEWTLEAPRESEIYAVDGRFLYCPEGWREFGGRVYFPADLSLRLFGLKLEDTSLASASLDDSGKRLLRGGEDYYAAHYPADDLFWLSHIIHAEAGGEPLAAQIGVGNVVLNRVRSEQFPDSVIAVVLDRENMVQFDPVENGTVARVPDEQAILAACLCLEGYNTVGESLFFINPALTDASWFDAALTPTAVIGPITFYTIP